MKTKFLYLVSAAALLWELSACHDPYEFTPTQYDEYFNSMTARFFDDDRDENSFPAEFDYANRIITIVIPYTYPPGTDNFLEPSDITNMKMVCNLKTGMTIEPALTSLDLSKDNAVTLIDNFGERIPFTIRGEIRKSTECEITDFALPTADVAAIINPMTKTIKLVTNETVGSHLALVDLSYGATLDPDPRVVALDYDSEPEITVIAQNGIDKTVYKVIKATPTKLPYGIRAGSAKILWAKKQSDLGLAVYTSPQMDGNGTDPMRFHGSAGLGIVGDYLVINDAGMGKAYYMNYKNGNLAGSIDLSAMGTNNLGHYNNHRMTSDQHGNLLFASSPWQNNNILTLWKMNGINGQLEKLITYNNYAAMGNTLSVCGNLDGDAIITTARNGGIVIYKWIIKNSVLQSAVPEQFTPNGYTGNCWGTMDIAYLDQSGSNLESDYISIAYLAFSALPPNASGSNNRTCAWHNGTSNDIKAFGSKCISSNSVENASDICTFNNINYYVHNVANGFTYGHGDTMFMYNLSNNDLESIEINFEADGLNFAKNYGAAAAQSTIGKAGNGNDVRFFISPDGFYIYIFFEFANGYVGAVRADCIDLNS